MNAYQKLTQFSGSLYNDPDPSYRGIEYDFEVPDNLVIASPGGVDSVRHHYTKGFYGRGNTSSDVYAGQQNRYISGEYGNLYHPGHGAAQAQGFYGNAPDSKWWMNNPTFPTDNPVFEPIIEDFNNFKVLPPPQDDFQQHSIEVPHKDTSQDVPLEPIKEEKEKSTPLQSSNSAKSTAMVILVVITLDLWCMIIYDGVASRYKINGLLLLAGGFTVITVVIYVIMYVC